MEFTLLWAALAGVGALYGALWWMGRRDLTLCVRDLWDIGLTAAVVGLAVGRVVAMLRDGVNPLTHLGDLLLVRAGVDTAAAAIAALVVAAWLARANLWELLDGLAPAAVIGIAGWHGGCVFRSACLGDPSSLPWAWSQSGSDVTRHPVELYAALGLVVAGWLLFKLRLRHLPPGSTFGLALAAVGLARLATEPLRPSLLAGPVWWYLAAVVVGVVTAVETARRHRSSLGTDGPPLQ